MEELKFYEPIKTKTIPPRTGDIGYVTIPVVMYFEYSDKIVDEVDYDGEPISYKSGYIMKPLNKQYIYSGEEILNLGSTMVGKN